MKAVREKLAHCAEALDRAIARSNQTMKVIEHQPTQPAPPPHGTARQDPTPDRIVIVLENE